MIVLDEKRAEAIAQVFSDEHSVRIITSTSSKPKGIEDISEEAQVPISTCYRRIGELVEMGILRPDRAIMKDGIKKRARYKRTFEKMTIRLEQGKLVIEIDSPTSSSKALEAPVMLSN